MTEDELRDVLVVARQYLEDLEKIVKQGRVLLGELELLVEPDNDE